MTFKVCVAYFMLCALCTTYTWSEQVRVGAGQNDKGRLPELLLKSALSRGEQYSLSFPYGDIESLPLSTRINGVKNGELDLFYGLSTPEYERDFLPVYIPLYKGMMGMRIAIVKKENEHIFQHVKTLEDLKAFSAGQGKFWADSIILEHNAMPLVKELKYKNLFPMLNANRFDYFPRGIQEPWSEIQEYGDLNLVVEPHIMIWYTAPYYYFVPKNNPRLAAYLTEQLEAMINDGTFDAIFNQEPNIQLALSKTHVSSRNIIRIINPFLSEKTPINRSELWFNPIDGSISQN